MASTKKPAAKNKVSAKAAAVETLRGQRKGLHSSEIIEKVLATKGVKLAGKTPGATINAILAVEAAKEDGVFERVEPGVFRLRPQSRAK
jgi:hypothetical protein